MGSINDEIRMTNNERGCTVGPRFIIRISSFVISFRHSDFVISVHVARLSFS